MRILVSNFGRQYCADLLASLEQNGWLLVFFTSFAANKLPKRFQKYFRKRAFGRIPTQKIGHSPTLFLLERLLRNYFPGISRWAGDYFDKKVALQLQKLKPDIVISYENTNCATMRMAKKLGITTVLDLAQIHHADILQYGAWFLSPERLENESRLVNPYKSEALRYTDYVLTLSTFAAESMLNNDWPATRLFTANLGIDPQRFLPKKTYGAEGPLRLLFVGTIMRRKGIELLLQAFQNLPKNTATLTLIGPMADAGDLLQQYADTGFVYFPFQHHEALMQHYQEADVFVFPSLLDSWAQTVLEAMACGTPAIVTENTGAKDAVNQGGGWVIPPNNLAALQAILNHCLADRSAIETRGRKAQFIARQYTKAHYQKQLTTILREIAERAQLSV